MPDWTYHPLRRPVARLLGERRSQRAALSSLAALASRPGGRWMVAGLGHTQPPAAAATRIEGVECAAPFGVSVSAGQAVAAIRAMPALGAGLVEVGPFGLDQVDAARQVLGGARHPVALRLAGVDALTIASALGPLAALVVFDMPDGAAGPELLGQLTKMLLVPVAVEVALAGVPGLPARQAVVIREASPTQVRDAARDGRTVIATTSAASPASAADLIDAGAVAVLATPAALVEAGPGWFHRSTLDHLARRTLRPPARTDGVAWIAGLGLGLGMIAGGIGATLVTLGPGVLPYDVSFLGTGAAGLGEINRRLLPFLQHDRITLAGTMVAIGIVYASLSWWGIRAGRAWARDVVLASGVVGFPTLFYFFAYRYVEPAHVGLAAILFPLFLIATWRPAQGGASSAPREGPVAEWRRALLGQLLMVAAGAGLIIGGFAISAVGLAYVFVPSDLAYMGTTPEALAAANGRLVSFIAHDRAGFGGALMSAGVAVTLAAAWGWERGQSWLWWSLAASAAAGFGAAVAVHVAVGYTDFSHVAPVYAGILVTAVALALARPFLLARDP